MKLKNKLIELVGKLKACFSKKPSLKHLSIKFKLPFYLLIFDLVMIVFLWTFEVICFENIYTYVKKLTLTRAGNQIVEEVDKMHADKLIEKVTRENDVCVTVTDENGTPIFTGINSRDCVSSISLDNFLVRVYTAKQHGGIYVNEFNKEEPFFDINASNPTSIKFKQRTRLIRQINYTGIAVHDDKTYIVLLDATLTPLGSTTSLIRRILILVTALMAVVAIILGWWLSKQITWPLLEISKQAKQLAKGDYDSSQTVDGYKEIHELSITLNQAAEDLKQVEKLRNELIANISHDLRTPLTMISGYAEMMRDLPGEASTENIQVILDETNHLSRLVNDVLDLSKLRSGAAELKTSRYSLTASIQKILERLQALSEAEGYRLSFEADCSVMIDADELKISQVIYNLCTNAISYTGADKKVFVRQVVSNQRVRIEIKDTGVGIAKDELDKIWERYYRTNNDHIRAKIGSGLGLSIVRQILDIHHAEYGVSSELNQGTTFWFELPIAEIVQN